MAIRNYSDYGTGDDTQFVALKQLLDRAPAMERIDVACDQRTLTPKSGAAVNLRRWVNPAVNDTGETEGVTPASRALTHEDFQGTMIRYSEVFEDSRYEYDLSPYDSVMGAKDVLQDLVARTRERIRFNAAVAGTSVIYNASAITARNEVNAPVTLGQLQVAVRAISAAKGLPFTALNNGNQNVGTNPVEAGFYYFCHTDCEPDLRALPGFKSVAEFGGGAAGYPPGTFGAVQNIIFITSPEALILPGAGAAIATMKNTAGNADVYLGILVAKHALTSIKLAGKGKGGYGNAQIDVLDKADKSDPTNSRVQVACSWYDLCMITSNEWLYRIESAATLNPA